MGPDLNPTISRMKNNIPQIPAHTGIPLHPAMLESSYVSHGYFSGFQGGENSYILLFLFLALVMYLRNNFTSHNSRAASDGTRGGASGGNGAATNGGAGNGNEGQGVIEPRLEICGNPPSFPGWEFESSTGLGAGATATYKCMEGNDCFIVEVSTCDAQGVWRELSACNPIDCE